VKTKIIRFLHRLGIGITSSKNLEDLRSSRSEVNYNGELVKFIDKINEIPISNKTNRLVIQEFSRSLGQIHQDLIALIFTGFKCEGYFVEFGATNGISCSNTYLLETSFGWTGILAEPAKRWHTELRKNRKSAIEERCVWRASGETLEFNQTEIGELSTLEAFSSGDMHATARESGDRYLVETISLEDLLDSQNAPRFIDYLSIDTEGSEFEILNAFNFERYSFGLITCEHNYTDHREQVFNLLVSKGYRRVLEHMSQFDDWYVHKSLLDNSPTF
jgi:FkbM family methyltransferase